MTQFIITRLDGKLVWTERGDFLPARMVGPGAYNAKIWKTRKGIEKFINDRWVANGYPNHVQIKEI